MNFLIDFEQTATAEQIAAYMEENGLSVIKEFNHFDKVFLASGQQPAPNSLVTSISNDDTSMLQLLEVTAIEDNAPEISFDTNEDRNWWKFTTIRAIDDADVVTMKRRGDAVNVYLVDSGIDSNHPEFVGANITNLYSITENFNDSTGHGTALASLIVGNTCAISNPALKVCKIFDQTGQVRQSELISAFDAIIGDIVTTPNKVAVVNLSWAIDRNPYIEEKIRVLLDYNAVVVCAAGNNGAPIASVTPAAMDEVITIGSYNHLLAPSTFSNYTGSTGIGMLDGWAPGENIYVAEANGMYKTMNGTSVAAAIHSAVVAYNSMQLIGADGNMLPCNRDITKTSKEMSSARKDLLQLEDPKYNNSINLISTCFNEFVASSRAPKMIDYIRFVNGIGTCHRIFHPMLVASYQLNNSLPEGLTLYKGTIYGVINLPEGQDYSVSTVYLDLTLIDGSTFTQTVHIYTKRPEYSNTNLPTSDSILSIFALAGTCISGCVNDCNPGDTCDCDTAKGSGLCYCLCSTCDCP